MRRKSQFWATASILTLAGVIGGCPPIRVPVDLNLNGAVGAEFAVQADLSLQRTFGLTFDNQSGITIGQGTFEIEAKNIAVIINPEGPGKGTVGFQASDNSITVTARVAAAGQESSVCTSDDEYGPFTVELSAENVPVSVSPSSITLSENTVTVLNSGVLTLCLEVLAPFNGMVTIHTLTLNVGP